MTRRVAIFISGGGSNMVSLVKCMTGDFPARPCVVLSNVAGVIGLDRAEALEVPTEVVRHQPFGENRKGFEHSVMGAIAEHKPDLICLAGFMRRLTPEFIDEWRGRMLNIHPSLLPKYKGLNTHRRALEAGDLEHGCTVHEVTRDLDEGPILGRARVSVSADDTVETLAARVLVQEHILYPQVLRRFIEGEKTPLFIDAR